MTVPNSFIWTWSHINCGLELDPKTIEFRRIWKRPGLAKSRHSSNDGPESEWAFEETWLELVCYYKENMAVEVSAGDGHLHQTKNASHGLALRFLVLFFRAFRQPVKQMHKSVLDKRRGVWKRLING